MLLGVRIAPGGEGSVHEVSGNQDIVAIYHQGRRPPENRRETQAHGEPSSRWKRTGRSRLAVGTVRRRLGRPDPRLPDATGQARRHTGRRIQILKAEEAAPGNQPAKPTKNPSTDGRDSRQVRRHNAEDARLRIRRRRRQRHALSHLDLDPTKLIASNRLLPKIRRQPPGCRLEEDGKASIAGPTTGC